MPAAKCIIRLLLVPITLSWANLTIRKVESDETTYPSAVFKYFSVHDGRTLENYSLVYLEGDNLCSPARDLVAGKIVLANLKVGAEINCWPTDAAETCAKYGAAAFVKILSYPPGLFSNMHFTFNPSAESIGIPYGSIAAADVGNVELELWQSTTMDGMVATLGPPYNHEYSDLFKSPLWLVVFQVALPAFALLVLCESIVEIRRRLGMHSQDNSLKRQQGLPNDRKMLSSAPLLICIIEGLSCASIGVILILGQFGPFYLPFNYHYFYLFLLTGSSFFTTLISALILHEKSKFILGLPSWNDIAAHYPKTIIACAMLCIGPDIVIGVTFIDPRAAYGNFTSFYGIYGVGQIVVAIYFLVQARAFYQPLMAYLTHPEAHPRPENEAQIRCLARILMLSSFAMLLNTSTMIFIAIRATGDVHKPSVFAWFTTMFVFSASRIGTSYLQVPLAVFRKYSSMPNSFISPSLFLNPRSSLCPRKMDA